MAGKTSKSAWTRRERDAAAWFGARRQPCSGSGGRSDVTRSDSTSGRIFLETKLRVSHAAVTLLDETRKLARKEGKLPVVALATKHHAGLVFVVAAEDLAAVAAELAIDPEPTPETAA